VAVGGGVGVVELVGREGEVDRLRRFVEQVPGVAGAALVRGEPGIGKTVLWREAVEAAEGAGIMVLATRCVEAEMPIAFGGLSDLFDSGFLDVAGELAEPQRRALAVALGIEAPSRDAPDDVTLPRAVVAALHALAARGPVLVAIDDVQWLDAASRRVVAFAVRRVGPLPVGVLVTLRESRDQRDPLALVEAFGVDGVVELELGALSSGALRYLLRSRVAVRLRRPTLLRVQEASGGNPMFALEFARLVASQADAVGDAPMSMPSSLRELVRDRVAGLPPEIRPLLELVATLERPTLAILADAFGPEAAEALLGEAQRAEAIAVGRDGVVRFTHPLLASAVYGEATLQRRRALHAQAAGLVTDLEARAAHLALAAEGPDAAVAAFLDEAAQRAAARGSRDAAADLAKLARLLTPRSMTREVAERTLAEARYLIGAGEVHRATAALDGVLAGEVTGRERAQALQLRATVDADAEVALALLEAALTHVGRDRGLQALILGQLAFGFAFWRGDPAVGEERAREAVALAEELADPAVLAGTLSVLGWIAALRGQSYVDVMERAIALAADPFETSASSSRSAVGLFHCWSGDLESARGPLEEELETARRRGEKWRAFVLLRLAEVDWRAGDLDAAERHATEAAEIFSDGGDLWGSSQVLTLQALLAAIRGSEPESRRLAQEAILQADQHHSRHYALANRWVLGFLELSLGQPARAHELLGTLPDALDELGVGEPGLIPALPDAVETLVALGRLDEAEAVLRRLEGQALALQHRWATPAALRCRALLLLARGESSAAVASAEAAVAGFEAAGLPLDRGRALLVAGDALRRLGERRRAAEKLEAAMEVFSNLGASLWLERAAKELRRANPRRGRDRELTSTERRVAVLVVSGLTNREVAGQLFTTISTVEAHLTRIYRKAGVRSRTELASRVAAGELQLTDT